MAMQFKWKDLETDRMILRKLTQDDAQDMFEYCSDSQMTTYSTWEAHVNLDDTMQFIHFVENLYGNEVVAPWGIEDKQTHKLIGTGGFVNWNVNHARAELGYAISREYWGKGYMTEAVKAMIQYGFNEMELIRVEARCHPDNIGSARVMEKSDMTFEGILYKHLFSKGNYEDVKMYSIINEELLMRLKEQ